MVGTRIICDRESGAPKGYAFVTLQSPAQAQNAMRGMQGYRIMERPITVKVSQPSSVLVSDVILFFYLCVQGGLVMAFTPQRQPPLSRSACPLQSFLACFNALWFRPWCKVGNAVSHTTRSPQSLPGVLLLTVAQSSTPS